MHPEFVGLGSTSMGSAAAVACSSWVMAPVVSIVSSTMLRRSVAASGFAAGS